MAGTLAVTPAAAYDAEHTAMRGMPSPMGQANGPVWAVEVAGGRVYAGGGFTSTRPAGSAAGSGETGQAYLAAFDATTGAPVTSFAPRLENDYTGGPATVFATALSPDGRTLYVGGDFNRVDGQRAEHLASFDTATGAFLGEVGRNGVDGTVRSLAVSPDGRTLYVGGAFSRANWSARRDLAAFDLTTGELTSWAPVVSDNVSNEALRVVSLAVSGDGSRVFLAGPFRKVNGAVAQGFMAVDASTGQNVAGWRADYLLAPYNWGTALETVGDTVYLGARDDVSGSLDRKEGVYAIDAASGAVRWYARCYGDTFALQALGNDLYVGSHAHDCADAGGMPETNPRTYLAVTALNRGNGQVKPYFVQTSGVSGQPDTMLLTRALATDGQTLVVGGGFAGVNGAAQANLVRFTPGSAPPDRAAWPSVRTCWRCSYVDVSVLEASDRDDVDLTYRIFRGWQTDTPIATVTRESVPYASETFTVRDTGVTPGSSTYYRVLVTDPAGNEVMSVRSATVTLTASSRTVRAGQPVRLTARVGHGQGGWVRFVRDGRTVGRARVVDGRARLRLPRLPEGRWEFAATWRDPDSPRSATMGKVRVRVTGS
ncbi:hypothetical protein [Nocardioides ferulae]|uniref:hypothetical protein n=1 Tax=Nocardioides ferulae TaxID=2340821 RepID=UPI000F88D2EF|nr:hypothetical protein [Nocardioides ferulae]